MGQVTTKGTQKVVELLSKVNVEVAQQARPLKQVGILLLNQIDTFFQISGNPTDGGSWQRNSLVTIARKGSSKPLIDTGRLRASFTFDYKPGKLTVGTPVQYAEFHQNGNRVPRRPMLPSDKEVEKVTIKQYNSYIANLIATS